MLAPLGEELPFFVHGCWVQGQRMKLVDVCFFPSLNAVDCQDGLMFLLVYFGIAIREIKSWNLCLGRCLACMNSRKGLTM